MNLKPIDFKPQKSFTIYKGQDSFKTAVYRILAADIFIKDQAPVYGSWEDLDSRSMEYLFNILKEMQSDSELQELDGLIPDRMLYQNGSKGVIWWRPEQGTTINLTEGLATACNLPQSFYLTLPPLVFLGGKGHATNIFMLKDNERPTLDTALYEAPFWNVSVSGEICWGSSKRVSATTLEGYLKENEEAFFNSSFSHASSTNYNLLQIWQTALKDGFPKDLLKESPVKNLSNLIKTRK